MDFQPAPHPSILALTGDLAALTRLRKRNDGQEQTHAQRMPQEQVTKIAALLRLAQAQPDQVPLKKLSVLQGLIATQIAQEKKTLPKTVAAFQDTAEEFVAPEIETDTVSLTDFYENEDFAFDYEMIEAFLEEFEDEFVLTDEWEGAEYEIEEGAEDPDDFLTDEASEYALTGEDDAPILEMAPLIERAESFVTNIEMVEAAPEEAPVIPLIQTYKLIA